MKISTFIIAVCAMMFSAAIEAQVRHEVKPGETLYGISHTYNVTIADIQAANPGMGENLMAGQVISIPGATKEVHPQSAPSQNTPAVSAAAVQATVPNSQVVSPVTTLTVEQLAKAAQTRTVTIPVDGDYILGADGTPLVDVNGNLIPRCKSSYVVKKKDTLFGIARDNGVTLDALLRANPQVNPDKKLKKGTELCIPYTEDEVLALLPPEPVVEEKVYTPVSVAIVMPYGLAEEHKSKDYITMIDFYEGAMLAIRDLKRDGISANVLAFDEADLDSMLTLPKMADLQLIIGPKDNANISKLIRYTEKHNIRLVVPMSSTSTLVTNHPNVYQVNTKMDSEDYTAAFQQYVQMNPNVRFLFVNIEEQTDKIEQVTRLKQYLNNHNMIYENIDLDNFSTITDVLSQDKENVIVLTSGTRTAFERVARKLAEHNLESYRISMYGYNDWQAFADKEADAFRRFRCAFFTSFYANPNSTSTLTFNRNFRSAFQREQYNTYPRYGMLGYDITNFFVRHMYEQGEDFEANIETLNTVAYQNPLHFKRKGVSSGYVNKAMMFVQYNADGSISVKQF